jgi:hypothetical protein
MVPRSRLTVSISAGDNEHWRRKIITYARAHAHTHVKRTHVLCCAVLASGTNTCMLALAASVFPVADLGFWVPRLGFRVTIPAETEAHST